MLTYIKNLFNRLVEKHEDPKRSSFKNFMEMMAPNIIVNWCMTKYYDHLNVVNDFKYMNVRNKQTDMLEFYLKIIAKRELKNCNKKRLIENVWVKKLHLNEQGAVANIIRSVFINEGADKYINNIANECAESWQEIIYMMTHDYEDIDKYIFRYLYAEP